MKWNFCFTGDFKEAVLSLKASLIYPENLGEGKLEGAKDNDIHFLIGCLYEKQGMIEEAKSEFIQATYGTDFPSGVLYYNNPNHIEARELFQYFTGIGE